MQSMTKTDSSRDPMLYVYILKMISRSKDITAKEVTSGLSDLYGINKSERQVQRVLKQLAETCDLQVNDLSKPYGYRWKPESVGLNLNNLTAAESLLLRLAERHVGHLLPKHLERSMSSLLGQARKNLGLSDKNRPERQWLGKIEVVSPILEMIPPQLDSEVLNVLADCLYADQVLNIVYRKLGGEPAEHRVEPYGLVQQGVRLYLVCRFLKHQEPIAIAVHRIQSAINTGHLFIRDESFDLKKFQLEGRMNYGDGKKLKLTLTTSVWLARQLEETPLSTDQTVRYCEDTAILVATVYDSMKLDHWILSQGDSILHVKKIFQ